jgi:hypothetical protein
MSKYGFNADETRVLKKLKTPERVQRFLDQEIQYNTEPNGSTFRSPRRVLRDQVAHCVEGAVLAAAILRVHGWPPLLLDLESVRDDDHVIAVFKEHDHWGAIAKSNYAGLRFREPVYRTLRELVMSYFEHYFNVSREKTLRNYSRPVNLAQFDGLRWMISDDDLWPINEHLVRIPHVPLLRNGVGRRLARVDDRLFAAGLVGQVRSCKNRAVDLIEVEDRR